MRLGELATQHLSDDGRAPGLFRDFPGSCRGARRDHRPEIDFSSPRAPPHTPSLSVYFKMNFLYRKVVGRRLFTS